MLSEKSWKPEAVLGLMLGLGVVLIGGGGYWQWLQGGADTGVVNQTFHDFLALTLLFDVLVLLVIRAFLAYHGVGWRSFLGLGQGSVRRRALLGIGVGLAVIPFALGLNKLCVWAITSADGIPEAQAAVVMFHESTTLIRRVAFALAAVVAAPVIEEFLFRGIFYPLIKQSGFPRTAIWGTSLMFAAVHFNLMTFVPLTFLALVLVWLYEKTDTLLAPILAHACFNGVNFAMLSYEGEIVRMIERIRS